MMPFDLIILGILLLSGILGFAQGAVKELVSLVSLVAALVLAMLGLRFVTPLIEAWMDPDWAAAPIAFLLVFALAYLGLRLLGSGLTGGIRQARLLSALDRALGFGFGLVRAALFLGVCNLAFTAATAPGYAPAWLQGSLFYPLTERSAAMIRALAPQGANLAGRIAPAVEKALGEGQKGDRLDDGGYVTSAPSGRDKAAETPR
jgi:membrane protein required for colicin V production